MQLEADIIHNENSLIIDKACLDKGIILSKPNGFLFADEVSYRLLDCIEWICAYFSIRIDQLLLTKVFLFWLITSALCYYVYLILVFAINFDNKMIKLSDNSLKIFFLNLIVNSIKKCWQFYLIFYSLFYVLLSPLVFKYFGTAFVKTFIPKILILNNKS